MALVPVTQRNQGGRLAARGEHPLERLQRDFDTLFGRLWSGWLGPLDQEAGAMRLWDFDVMENDQEIIVRAEMPGFESSELDVQLSNDVLTIKAQKQKKGNGEEERRSFFRSVTLPSSIDAEKVQATYRNGVLELRIPRAQGAQPRHIAIQQEAEAGEPKTQAAIAQAGNQGQQAKSPAGATTSEKTKV